MADVEYKFIDNTVLADEVIGHANISSISDGTLRGAVKKINTDLDGVKEHLQSVVESDNPIGTNVWNEKLELGNISGENGSDVESTLTVRTIGFTEIEANKTYYCVTSINTYFRFYDLNKTFLSTASVKNNIFTTPNNAKYFRFVLPNDYGQTYKNDISIFEYEEGKTYSYVQHVSSNKVLTQEVSGINSSLSRKLLWSNTNTSSEFAQTTITLNDNIANYQRYEIIYRENTTTQLYKSSGIIDKDLSNITCNTVSYNTWRTNSAPNGTSLSINGGRKQTAIGSAADDNTILIPYRVYGYKY